MRFPRSVFWVFWAFWAAGSPSPFDASDSASSPFGAGSVFTISLWISIPVLTSFPNFSFFRFKSEAFSIPLLRPERLRPLRRGRLEDAGLTLSVTLFVSGLETEPTFSSPFGALSPPETSEAFLSSCVWALSFDTALFLLPVTFLSFFSAFFFVFIDVFLLPVLLLLSSSPSPFALVTLFLLPVIFLFPSLFFTLNASENFLLPGCFLAVVFAATAAFKVLFSLSVLFLTDSVTDTFAPGSFLEGAFSLPVLFLTLFRGFLFSEAGFPCFPPPSPGSAA